MTAPRQSPLMEFAERADSHYDYGMHPDSWYAAKAAVLRAAAAVIEVAQRMPEPRERGRGLAAEFNPWSYEMRKALAAYKSAVTEWETHR